MPPSKMAEQASVEGHDSTSTGDKILDRLDIKQSENGGFVVEQRYSMKPKKGRDKVNHCGLGYMEPEVFTFETFESLQKHLQKTFGKE